MTAIILRADLAQSLTAQTPESQKSLTDLVNEAVESYLLQLHEKRLDQEVAAYERMYPQLRETHPGHWVAIHQQRLVDADQDQLALFERVHAMYQDKTVLMRQVGHQSVEEIWVRTPSTGKVEA